MHTLKKNALATITLTQSFRFLFTQDFINNVWECSAVAKSNRSEIGFRMQAEKQTMALFKLKRKKCT